MPYKITKEHRQKSTQEKFLGYTLEIEDKIYTCECGAIFNAPYCCNNHKGRCSVHLSLIDKLQSKVESEVRRRAELSSAMKQKHETQQKQKLDLWISEKHTCERCGKVMTEKYGSGRFCSKSCANSHPHDEEYCQKLSAKTKGRKPSANSLAGSQQRLQERQEQYLLAPAICKVCGHPLSYERRHKKTCSDACYQVQVGGFREGSVKNHKYGTYKGTHCDSSWELAFVTYCMDHNIEVRRNTQGFKYQFEGRTHEYFPDFIAGNTYIEIKGYQTSQVIAKQEQFPAELNYKILYGSDLKQCISYCQEHYGKNFPEVLYDKAFPSYLDRN